MKKALGILLAVCFVVSVIAAIISTEKTSMESESSENTTM